MSKHYVKCRSYRDRKGDLQKHRQKALSIIRGQFQKVLIDKMMSYTDGEISEQSGNPLILIKVIENI